MAKAKKAAKKVARKKPATKKVATKKVARKKVATKKVARKKVATKKVARKKPATKKVARKASEGTIMDMSIQALKPGKRISINGKVYYESRGNRSDKGKWL